ncbi:MAG: D-lactate dehydrogenase [Rhizobiales bacterium]|nr:D-lactate dehydrogenase [Hyphomicrobiales bacterium]NRB15854.1 D-lactate dehydrogenase [Hyphomicrobiales bacterium]
MAHKSFIADITNIVGSKNILTKAHKTKRYRTGFRSGEGEAIAVVFPTSLLMQWQVLQACVKNDIVIIMQAANTGLTEGSTPNGNEYGRDVVILNTTRMDKIHVINDGKQVVALPGATLYNLEKQLLTYDRLPHSEIGSSCIGASIVGGVCNNSGGALIHRGPAYTELALFAQIHADGRVELVNRLGIDLGQDAESMLKKLDDGLFDQNNIEQTDRLASDQTYQDRVRNINADTPSRFNADKDHLFETSGCAGKLVVFAVRLDTYGKNQREQLFYIGTNSPNELSDIRKHILSEMDNLPILAEYMHKDIYEIAKKYGKDVFVIINLLGTSYLPMFFTLKGNLDAWFEKLGFLPKHFADKMMQFLSIFLPNLLPKKIENYREKYNHYLMIKMADDGIAELDGFLSEYFAKNQQNQGEYYICPPKDSAKILLHRFVAAGSAVRYQAVHHQQVEEVIALDVALKRNEENWFETLPKEIEQQLSHKLYYGHFMCHVFHQDYIVKKGADTVKIKTQMLEIFNQKGAEYPAEHNVGHVYKAKPDLANFYQQLDPTNSLNPGIGKVSKLKFYK